MRTEPIDYRGQSFTAAKQFTEGTHRICSPEDTLVRIYPYFESVGLTRLADITGLDKVGIPVVLSIRPNAGYLAVDAGKGFTLNAAKVSAAMETIERYHGEKTDLPELYLPYRSLSNVGCDTIEEDLLLFSREHLFNVNRPERWVLGWDIVNQCEVAVPAVMVFLRRYRWPFSEPASFQSTSNGLASGNHFLEAVTSGLLEVIERDATTCWQPAINAFYRRLALPRVRLDTIEHPLVLEALEKLSVAQVQAILFDCTTDTDVPTYMAWVYERHVRNTGIGKGYGTHLDPEIAMLRALTEALQGRLVYIAGARDDAFHWRFDMVKKDDTAAVISAFEAIPTTVDARERVSEATATFEGDLHLLITKLRRIGLRQIIVFDLTLPGFDASVVRVVVPGLEGYIGTNFYLMGPRARRFLQTFQQREEMINV